MEKMNELIERLCEYAEWARVNEWEVPLCMADDLETAAKRIEETVPVESSVKERSGLDVV